MADHEGENALRSVPKTGRKIQKTLLFTFESNWPILHFPGRHSFQQGIACSTSITMLAEGLITHKPL
jgi:hypothetical protein